MLRAGTLGVLLGGAAGFALGILLAPEEGQKMRRRLAYHLENLADQVNVYLDQITRAQTPGDARQRGESLVADARTRAQRIQDDIEALMGEVKRHGSSSNPTTN